MRSGGRRYQTDGTSGVQSIEGCAPLVFFGMAQLDVSKVCPHQPKAAAKPTLKRTGIAHQPKMAV
jgi:hypothetical protein